MILVLSGFKQVALAQFNDDVLIEFATNSEVLVAGSTMDV